MQYYIMDGRANYDVEDALILEVFDAEDDEAALEYMEENYDDMDVALVNENMVLV